MNDPGDIVLDEPINGMNPLRNEEMMKLSGKIFSSKKSILVSPQMMQNMKRLYEHAISIQNGKAPLNSGHWNIMIINLMVAQVS